MKNNYDKEDSEFEKGKEELYQPDDHPETEAESNRKSGLAYGAVITLIGSILVFLGIGWVLDVYLHTAPWLLVSGIILGAIVGFYQFIRISSQIN